VKGRLDYKVTNEDFSEVVNINKWPKYNDTKSTGLNMVNVENYWNRWNGTGAGFDEGEMGLKQGVINYMKSSGGSELIELPGDGSDEDFDSTIEINYVDLLNIAAIDFHVARMLGIGHIDQIYVKPAHKWIYMAEYVTKSPLEGQSATETTHFSMSLPTDWWNREDFRLPLGPQTSLSYGLTVGNGTIDPNLLSDENGYSRFENVRYVNLHRQAFPFELGLRPFFEGPNYDICQNTFPVAYGIEYRKKGQATFIQPEILHDENYKDVSGSVAETVTVPEHGDFLRPVYTHQETKEGTHEYSLYSVNWFSIPSPVADVAETNETKFPKSCHLLPPSNFAAHLVQQENPRIFTTAKEQELLAQISGSDKTLVRLTFEWNKEHFENYQDSKPVTTEFFFRSTAPQKITGTFSGVEAGAGNQIEVEADFSGLTNANAANFVGSLLVSENGTYIIDEAKSGKLVIRASKEFQLINTDNEDGFMATPGSNVPTVGASFFILENMLEGESWQTQLSKTVQINHVKGFEGTGTIKEKEGINGEETTGIYTFTTKSMGLPLFPDLSNQSAEWYHGTIEVPRPNGGEPKVLPVWNIEILQGNILKLTIADPTLFIDSNETDPILTDEQITAHFFPGYRLYLKADGAMNEENLLPANDELSKFTYVGTRYKVEDCTSAIAPPVALLGQNISEPKQPEKPVGPEYATRPDFYGKSTYTFDVEVDTSNGRKPHALVFFRGEAKEGMSMEEVLQKADNNEFIPLTKNPVLYGQLEESMSGNPSTNPDSPAVRFGENKVRFTDYTLDGASTSVYYYYAIELSNRLVMSERSEMAGPVKLVNTYPPEEVAIKKVLTSLGNTVLGIPTAVRFEVNPYVASEGIQQFQIYRASSPQDAVSVRTMQLAATVGSDTELLDTFEDLEFPPYNEPLFYRIVALREITNERAELEYVPSKPSNVALASIIDVNNPPAPELSFNTSSNVGSNPDSLENVVVKWSKTVHNGKYYLYKMNAFGNWVKIHSLSNNDGEILVDLSTTNLSNATLEKKDDNGQTIFHHFKGVAENASGLLSLEERILTI